MQKYQSPAFTTPVTQKRPLAYRVVSQQGEGDGASQGFHSHFVNFSRFVNGWDSDMASGRQ